MKNKEQETQKSALAAWIYRSFLCFSVSCFSFFLLSQNCSAQTLHFPAYKIYPIASDSSSVTQQADFSTKKHKGVTPTSPHILPEYAKMNPSGYSFLCRQEIKWENEWKIPVWFSAGDIGNTGDARILLKLKQF